jgi:Flp pilus assembly pilin Flp
MPRIAIALLADESGSTAIEYALIAGLISVAAIAGMRAIGVQISQNFFGPISTALAG